ncbi:MAG: ribosome biogenesis GTP-binding protein YihA/YsxC [Clostridia bacterium]|nr:ribosome biogenesis GTP-binding protein YihA/YsxC [Clostridia bacterium]
MLKINARFIISAGTEAQFQTFDKPVIAVCGRSNVGKSTFLNKLANNGKLARTSKDPGRTRLINYFDFGPFVMADLPGYGYAKVSKGEADKWASLMEKFFAKAQISHAFSLVDIRHEPTEADLQMINYLYANNIPFTIIATKADKLSKEGARKGVRLIAQTVKCGEGNIIAVSSQTGSGFDKIMERLEQIVSTGDTLDA